ncbi:hypothetical protein [Streptomyces sp. ML-6]|uniref:hypothetical protein n=1 Tax=Streptomyces sp. ML-6 TaxID=2982693 RepID=UPI0024BFD60C|nr:hypothetical protein [Streptomyces sp. ML-6]MDK0517906.1 hypothetical protein [Streptomyces sp. ML-6]
MSVPAGAYAVQFTFTAYSDNVEIGTTFEIPLSSSPSQLPHEDAAAQAAAEAYRAAIAAAYPAVPVHANRVYLCRQQGDTWPASA